MKTNKIITTGGLITVNKVDYKANAELVFDKIEPDNTNVTLRYRYQIPVYGSNMVVNGPFGNVGGRYIALSDKSFYLHNLNESTIYKYAASSPYGGRVASGSTNKPIARDAGTSMFSSAEFNLFWVGSDTFIDSEQDKWLFNADGQIVDYDPSEYTFSSRNEVNKMVLSSNGILFANTLYWAIYSSEYKASKIH